MRRLQHLTMERHDNGAIVVAVVLVVTAWYGWSAQAAVTFSIDPGSPSIGLGPGITPADLLNPGPIGGPPTVAFTAAALGLAAGDDVNAVSFGHFVGGGPYFSVDRASVGVAGTAVSAEAALGQAAGDIYTDPLWFRRNFNVLSTNQNVLGLLPAIAAGVGGAPPIDNLDALDMDDPSLVDTDGNGIPNLPVYFSLAPGSPTLAAIGAGSQDILRTAGGAVPVVAFPGANIGLVGGDDIDALVYLPLEVNFWYSLAPGSPSLALAPGYSAADVFFGNMMANGVPIFGPTRAALGVPPNLGLLVGDNIDAFSDTAVPEPASIVMLLALALAGGAGWWRRRRKA